MRGPVTDPKFIEYAARRQNSQLKARPVRTFIVFFQPHSSKIFRTFTISGKNSTNFRIWNASVHSNNCKAIINWH